MSSSVTERREDLGIIMLNAKIPRPVGDIGNPETFAYPVRYKIVEAATISRVVRGDMDPALLEPFTEAAKELEAAGCKAITTSCGFLAMFQKELAAAVSVPVFTSSLLQLKTAAGILGPGRHIGILASSSDALTEKHLAGVGAADLPVVIEGMDDSTCFAAMRSANPVFDPEVMRREAVEAALRLKAKDPTIGAVVIECTNLAPYTADIRAALDLPVFDILTLTEYIHNLTS